MVKMEPEKMSSEVKEARYIIAEINDLLSVAAQWAGDEADAAVKGLHQKWHELMAKTEDPVSKEFIDGCTKLLDECESFHTAAGEKILSFVGDAKEKISTIRELAGNEKDTMSILEEVLKLWNETVQPQIKFLCDNTADLTSSIMDMMKFVVEPVETTSEKQ
jgi:gas vesicle protein